MTESDHRPSQSKSSDVEINLEKAMVFSLEGQFAKSIPLYEKALAGLERNLGEDHPELEECLLGLAQAFEKTGRLNDSLRINLRLLRALEGCRENDDCRVAEILLKLTRLNQALARPADAFYYIEQALDFSRQFMAADDPLTLEISGLHSDMCSVAEMQARNSPPEPTAFFDVHKHFEPVEVPGTMTAKEEWTANSLSSAHSGAASDVGPGAHRSAEGHYFGDGEYFGSANYSQERSTGASGLAPTDMAVNAGKDSANAEQSSDHMSGVKRPVGNIRLRSSAGEADQLRPKHKMPVIILAGLALSALVATLLFFVLFKPTPSAPSRQVVLPSTPLKTTEISQPSNFFKQFDAPFADRYRTADGVKQILLMPDGTVVFASAAAAIEMPARVVAADWAGLTAAMLDAVREKQIWGGLNKSILRTSDNITYYAADGPEALVIAKMKRLAGFAQGYFLRCGEYPKAATSDLSGQLNFLNPLDNRDSLIAIRTLPEKDNFGGDALKLLESGQLVVDEPTPLACQVTCYAVMSVAETPQGQKMKATRFFVRGWDRNGTLLPTTENGRGLVLSASNEYMLQLDQSPEGRTLSRGRAAAAVRHSVKGGKVSPGRSPPSLAAAAELGNLPRQKPAKPITLWLISDPPCPLSALHYALPIVLALLALFSLIVSQMKGVDMKGKTTSGGSRLALIAAQILFSIAVLILLLELFVFN
ncbi:MAG: tetratricopeptide repeat protein [Cyanobacteria bacterium REEB67]|nr:tetratricopeptide repeat protein [Cyanobacteria bacterium REEB67]